MVEEEGERGSVVEGRGWWKKGGGGEKGEMLEGGWVWWKREGGGYGGWE